MSNLPSTPRTIRALALGALLATASLAAAAPVPPFTATYEVRRNGQVLGEATLRLSNRDSGGTFSNQTRGTQGLARLAGVRIDETSHFAYTTAGLETRSFRFRQDTNFNRRERDAKVDPAGGMIHLRDRDGPLQVPYVAGVVDHQTITIALMQAVIAGRNGMQHFQVIGRRGVAPQTWRIGAAETVPTASPGERGVRVERVRETADGRSTVMWLDTDSGHVPLRIEQTEDDGERIEMRLLRRG